MSKKLKITAREKRMAKLLQRCVHEIKESIFYLQDHEIPKETKDIIDESRAAINEVIPHDGFH